MTVIIFYYFFVLFDLFLTEPTVGYKCMLIIEIFPSKSIFLQVFRGGFTEVIRSRQKCLSLQINLKLYYH
jgi:hypothetical protein